MDAPKKGNLKLIIISIVVGTLILAGIAWWYFHRQSKAAATQEKGLDDADKPAFDSIVAKIKSSQFSADLPYILDIYSREYAPGKPNAPADAYSTVAGKATLTGGLMKAVWTGWIGTYINNEDKNAAAQALANDVAGIWQSYKASALQNMA
ncbi:MAG: hypothetical protein EBX41_00820 [Chitinophagia bacterium]|nr:hypothetical protein [Chitinophagia bacterium]